MGDNTLQIGLSALQAAQQSLEVTSNNIANVNTPGYTEEQTELSSVPTINGDINSAGQGVQVVDIQRLANTLLSNQIQQASSETSRLNQMSSSLTLAQSTFNEPGTSGLSSVINSLYTSLQSLSSDPGSTSLTSATVAQLGSFTQTLNSLGSNLQNQSSQLTTSLGTSLTTINQLTSQIASLNQLITTQTAVSGNPNSLLDQRGQLINQLAGYMNIQVNQNSNGSINIDSGGSMLVGGTQSVALKMGVSNSSASSGGSSGGGLAVLDPDGVGFPVSGGSMGALLDLGNTALPNLISGLNTFTASFAQAFNETQATGTSSSADISSYLSDMTIPADQTATNLSSPTLLQTVQGGVGLTALPSFTNAAGNPTTTNLTINVLNQATGVATKYTLQYNPTTGNGGDSLDDLVAAINSGRSTGGFTLYPSNSGGVAGVLASEQPVAGGVKLSLQAQQGLSIDFSPALDLQPTATAWSSGATTVTGSDPALAGQRLVFQVDGNTLNAYTIDPTTGAQVPYGTSLGLGGTSGTIGNMSLTLTAGASSYINGQTFAVDFDGAGNIEGGSGSYTQAQTWTPGDASMTVSGQYTGSQTFNPATQWSMQVLSPGTIGAATGAPVVQFSYYTGPANAPVQQTTQVALGSSNPAGTPIQIADGVYATFGAGTLTTVNNQVNFTVDGQSDQANLLSTLGIGGMFTGSTASTIQVSNQLQQNPNDLAVGTTRASGDNANVQNFSALSTANLAPGGTSTLSGYYQSLVTNLGVQVQQTTQVQTTQSALTTSLQNQLQQSSGVSVDQEVTNMILQQQAYTAAARIISTEQTNINTLMQMMQ